VSTNGALSGTRVVDFGWAWAGAICGQILGDFGAEVIKVESRSRLDPMRQGRPIVGDKPDPEQNPISSNINRNKLSFAINLKKQGAIDLVHRLIGLSDIVVENMSVGVLDRLGLGYEDLKKVRPDVIMVSLPAAGRTGPLSRIRAYGPTITGLSGVDSLVGYENEIPTGFQQPMADPNVGLHALLAVLAALRHRRRTGEGQYIESSQLQALLPLLGGPIAEYTMTGRVPGPQDNRRPGFGPYGTYACAGRDQWVSIAVATNGEWRSLCEAVGHPELVADPRFADPYLRYQNRTELDGLLTEWTSTRNREEVAELLQASGVAAAPCLGVEGRFFNEHFRSREAYVPVTHPILGSEFIYGTPWKFSQTPGQVHRRVPLLGEHNDYVTRDLLGLSADQVTQLEASGVLE
jgi:benzylsuccinate CoA-transferase BbsF subunit